MLGQLVPCGGGKAIPLPKPRLVLRRGSSSTGDEASCAYAELSFADGVWAAKQLSAEAKLTINDAPFEQGSLMPDDVLAVAGKRYRIVYKGPGAPAAAVRPAPVKPAVDSFILGLLVPCAGGPAVPLKKAKLIVGRAPTCDIVLPKRAVSSRHCALEHIEGHWRLTDLDSTNGTLVDEVPFHRKWLFPGSILEVASLRFRIEYVPRGERPVAADEDVPVMPKRSLMERVGLTGQRAERAFDEGDDADDDYRQRRQTLDT